MSGVGLLSRSDNNLDGDFWASLVPELVVTELNRSISFYRDACGFTIRYARAEDGFAFLELGKSQIMLEEISTDAWLAGPLEPPFGRGMNLQIEVPDAVLLHDRLVASGARMFRMIETKWYRQDNIEHGQRQFIVQDPDGYLLRFMQDLGQRPAKPPNPA
jgi:catechol 2,3-dioxygenase-like lactoylglutathione lyase family enzyme